MQISVKKRMNLMKKIISVFLSLTMIICLALPCAAANADTSFGAYEHVFIIGVDGAGAAFSKVDSPNFDRIFADNAFTHNAQAEDWTMSAPNWASILTGVDYTTHGMSNDSTAFGEPQRTSDTDCPTIFYYARQAFPKAPLVSINHWFNINHGIVENDLGVRKVWRNSDPLTVDATIGYIKAIQAPKLLFVQLDDVDHAAHTYGGYSDEYYEAVREMDKNLGLIYDAAESRGLMENSLFIVVADHGECENGHGGNSADERTTVVAVAGRTVNKTELKNVRNRDVAAIALYALGIKQPDYFTAKVPSGLFGEESKKTVAKNPISTGELLWHDFLYSFVRGVNLLVGLFDFIEL